MPTPINSPGSRQLEAVVTRLERRRWADEGRTAADLVEAIRAGDNETFRVLAALATAGDQSAASVALHALVPMLTVEIRARRLLTQPLTEALDDALAHARIVVTTTAHTSPAPGPASTCSTGHQSGNTGR